MKKIIIAIVCFIGFSQVNAQVTFKPGIRTGLNLSKITQAESSYQAGFYFTGFGELKLSKFYTLQPEIGYSQQGGSNVLIQVYNDQTNQYFSANKNITIDYISFAILNKFTFNEQFNFHLGPTLDFQSGQNIYTNSDVDLAFFLGMGYNVTKNLAIEARLKKGIIDVYETDYFISNSEYIGDYNTNFLFQLGISYTFNLKQS